MRLSLDDILTNPKLEAQVTIDWVKEELEKQPYNRYLQDLLGRKRNEYGKGTIKSFISSIMQDQPIDGSNAFYIRDIELDTEATFAQAKGNNIEEKEAKKEQITKAAIGAGALMTGSIVTGAKEAAEEVSSSAEPLSQTDQIEESGLLGFLNRLDGTVKRNEPTASVDPMLKEGNYQKKIEDVEVQTEPERSKETNTNTKTKSEKSDKGAGKKKKTMKEKPGKGLRWSSMTPSDYKIKTLDPFTEWINTIDGVELIVDSEEKKGKKKKKKKKKGKHLDSLQDKPEIASEQLADLLVNQGHIKQAIEMYQRLSLKYPEKSSFFASKIENIKDK